MKQIKNLFIVCLLLGGSSLIAQKAILSPFIGYTFQNRFQLSGGEAKIEDGTTYGATLAFPLSPENAIEILYSRQETVLQANSIYMDDFREDISMNYILIGGKKTLRPGAEGLELYGGMKVGAGFITSTNDNYSTVTRFAVGLNLGFAYYLNDVLGIHGMANMNFPITSVGAGLGWSSSGGASVGMTGWSPLVQFTLGGGLSLRLGT